jgi:hypothetical protein
MWRRWRRNTVGRKHRLHCGRAAADRISSCLSLDSNCTAVCIYLATCALSFDLRKRRCAPVLPSSNRCAIRVSIFTARFVVIAFTCKTIITLITPIIPPPKSQRTLLSSFEFRVRSVTSFYDQCKAQFHFTLLVSLLIFLREFTNNSHNDLWNSSLSFILNLCIRVVLWRHWLP